MEATKVPTPSLENDGYGKVITNYFWYKSSSDTGIVKVNGSSYTYVSSK